MAAALCRLNTEGTLAPVTSDSQEDSSSSPLNLEEPQQNEDRAAAGLAVPQPAAVGIELRIGASAGDGALEEPLAPRRGVSDGACVSELIS